jgi:TolB-like protein
MDGANVPVSDAPNPNDSKSASFSARVRQRLKKIGAIIASVGAIGAVIGGLAGYWRTWDIVYSHVGGDHTKIAEPTALIFSSGPSIAVLPISNPVKSMALDPIADAMTQQLVSSLGRFRLLRVIPRTTTANFLKQGDPIEKARGAGVDYLVTGEVRPLREGARANIQIADLRSGLEVWSSSFDATAEGVQKGTDAYEIGDIAAAQINSAIETGEYKKIQKLARR